MQRKYFWIVGLWVIQGAFAQEEAPAKISGILQANSGFNTTLVFPGPIKQGVCGSENFRFIYDAEHSGQIGLLKASSGSDSNLLVVTEAGNLYSFIVKYAENIEVNQINHFIQKDRAIGNLSSNIVDGTQDLEKENSGLDIANQSKTIATYDKPLRETPKPTGLSDGDRYFSAVCAELTAQKPYFIRYLVSSHNMALHVNRITYDKDVLYVTFRLENNSAIGYEVDFVAFFIGMRKLASKSATQPLRLEPMYTCNIPKSVEGHTTTTFVYGFKKFSIASPKALVVELNERGGERNLQLKILAKDLNNAQNHTFVTTK